MFYSSTAWVGSRVTERDLIRSPRQPQSRAGFTDWSREQTQNWPILIIKGGPSQNVIWPLKEQPSKLGMNSYGTLPITEGNEEN